MSQGKILAIDDEQNIRTFDQKRIHAGGFRRNNRQER